MYRSALTRVVVPPGVVTSDTSISATAPAGAIGTTLHITVTTPGGTTTQVNADLYTYN